MGGNLKKIVTFGTECFVHYSWNVRYWGCPLLGGFTVLIKLDRQKSRKFCPPSWRQLSHKSSRKISPRFLEYALVITFLEENC